MRKYNGTNLITFKSNALYFRRKAVLLLKLKWILYRKRMTINMHIACNQEYIMQLTFDKIDGNEEGEEQEFVEILLFLLY